MEAESAQLWLSYRKRNIGWVQGLVGMEVLDPVVALEEVGSCLSADKAQDFEGRVLDSPNRMGLDIVLYPVESLNSGLDMKLKRVDR